jgi:hypothetical protein
MLARSHADLHNIRQSVQRIRGVSDRMIGLGPLGIGMDGILSLVPIPAIGVAYSGLAALALMLQAVRARASPGVLFHMGLLLVIDTMLDAPAGTPVGPISGLLDTLFTGHKWSANLLLKHMDNTVYVEGSREEARGRPDHEELMARVRAGREKRRIVYLD